MTTASPDDVIAALDARCTRSLTSCGDGHMVWRHWLPAGAATAPPLVLLHGGSGSWRHWIRNIDALGQDREIWVPDLPGFGQSGVPPAPVGFAGVSSIVAAGLREVLPGDVAFDLAGFSFGSHCAQYVAAELGARVRTVVLVTAHMLGPMLAQPSQMLERWRDITEPGERERILKGNLGALMLAHEASMDALALQIYAADVVRARIRPARFINDRDFTLIDGLPSRIAGIAGTLDPLGIPSPAAQGEMLLLHRPDAQFHLIENAGHWVSYEAPDRFNAVLRQVLTG